MSDDILRNHTFAELEIGAKASLSRTVGRDDIELFATVSGDRNPAHLDSVFAANDRFGHVVAHGMWTAALVSAVLGTRLPGPGTIYLGQDLKFRQPVLPGDTITAEVTVVGKQRDKRIITLDTVCRNQRGEAVLLGSATVIAPESVIEWPAMPLPQVYLRRHDRYEALITQAKSLPPLRTAVVHPCSAEAVQAVAEGKSEGLLDPILIGPDAKIRAAFEAAGLSSSGYEIQDAPHSHAAAAQAVTLASGQQVAALMKGSLHTDELLEAVVAPTSGLRTDRRLSHAYLMDIPAYAKPLLITDAAININPTLEQKRDICQNAIDLMRALGREEPLVAVLAAVETINPKMPATLDAAALTLMAQRGQITGAKVDGPLAFDNAINLDAAKTKALVSPVAGQADILLVPDIEAGNILAKQLTYFAGADAAGIVLGARVPIILTSRTDAVRVRLASIALANLALFRAGAGATA
ncbi:bifunctional enoyl-CoA hydratase/phosphate acetyltransferase [Lacibacterium aquatile]|uniref:Bifunctional enoyl-CoA hydratase/phosphate acetyltransferase n=1 Tax=Lacibacterium aquatile TaxID=1168082 RepID=A0ABW5DR72_9PROT